MNYRTKLVLIRSLHTAVWLFFNGVIFYLVHAVITARMGIGTWIAVGLILLEVLVLLAFRMKCPLTLLARRYSNSTRDNFDIYLPNWLARHNQVIYGALLWLLLIGLAWRSLHH